MSDLQNQDSANDFQDLVQQALNAPNFAERRAKCLAFFQEDAAQFERKVPSDRIPQVKRIFKLIKELDPPAFKLLKSMRTAVGLLDEPLRDYILQGLKDVREGLKAGLFTASAAHALIFLVILEPFQSSYQPKTALCAVPAITLKLFVVIIRAINRQKARYLWLFASKWQSTVQVGIVQRQNRARPKRSPPTVAKSAGTLLDKLLCQCLSPVACGL